MKYSRGKAFSFLNNIYVNIKQSNAKISIFHLISYTIEVTHILITLDIIFTKNTPEVNLYFPLYFISPIFLIKFLIAKYSKNCTAIPYDIYNHDQMSLILSSKLKLHVYDANCSLNIFVLVVIGIIVLIFICFIVLGTTKDTRGWKRVVCTIMSFFIFFFNKTFLPLLAFGLLENVSQQIFTSSAIFFTPMFIVSLSGFIIFTCSTFFFRKFLLNSYLQNEFLQENNRFMVVIFEFTMIILDNVIISIRYYSTNHLFFKSIVVILYIVHLYFLLMNFTQSLFKTIYQKGRLMIHLFYFCLGFVKSVFIVIFNERKEINHTLTYKLFELLVTLLLYLAISQTLNTFHPIFPLSEVVEHSFKNFKNRYSGIKELYLPLIAYLENHLKLGKSTDTTNKSKDKLHLINYYQKMLLQHFVISERDIYALDDHKSSKRKMIQKFLYGKPEDDAEEFKLLIEMLIHCLNKISKGIGKATDNIQLQETIKIIKVVLFYIYDDKTFRAQYFLSCIHNSDYYAHCTYHFYFLISYLYNTFFYFSQNEEHAMIQVIYSLEVEESYLKIIKSFKLITEGIQKTKKAKMKIIDQQNEIIGEAYGKIVLINKSNENPKMKDQYQIEKYRLVDSLLFAPFHYRFFDMFDLVLLEYGPSKNIDFVLSFEGNELILRKIPYKYVTLTGFKSNSYIGKDFAFLLSPHTRESFMKEIKKNILHLSQNSFNINSVMPTQEGHIIGLTLKCSLLPLFAEQFYIVAAIESDTVITNIVLLNTNGNAHSFGNYFTVNFGLSAEMLKINFFKVFNAENFMVNYKRKPSFNSSMIPFYNKNNAINNSNNKNRLFNLFQTVQSTKTIAIIPELYKKQYNIPLEKLIDNIIRSISFEEATLNNSNRNHYIQAIKDMIRLKIKTKDNGLLHYFLQLEHLYHESIEEYLLVSFSFEEIQKDKQCEESLKDSFLLSKRNYSILQAGSGSSVISSLGSNESNWSIQERKKQKSKIATNAIIRVILIYDIFLILVSIIFLVIAKNSSTQFINYHTVLINLVDLTVHYLMGQFYISNMININNNNVASNYEKVVNENIKPESISFSELYQFYFKNITTRFFPLYENVISNISVHFSPSWKDENFNYPLMLIKFDGTNYTEEYLQFWNIPKNNFYILSNLDNFILNMPPFENLTEIYKSISSYNSNQRIILSEIVNYFSVRDTLFNCTDTIRNKFYAQLHNFTFEVYTLFFIYLFLQFVSFFLSLFGITSVYQRLIKISDTITSLPKNKSSLLIEKLKQIKKIIKAEQKPSIIFTQLKEKTRKIKSGPNYKSMRDNNFDSSGNLNSNNNEESVKLLDTKKAIAFLKGSFKFRVYRSVLRVIIALSCILLIYPIIACPVLSTFFNRINAILNETARLTKFKMSLLTFYLEIKYLIFVNNIDQLYSTDFLPQYSYNIFSNYSLFKRAVNNDKNFLNLKHYFDKIDSVNGCNSIIDQNMFNKPFLALCNYQTILTTPMENMFGFYVNKIKIVFNNFKASFRMTDDQVVAFHSSYFIDANFHIILFFFNFVAYSKEYFLFPQFTINTNSLIGFLILIFVLMTVTEIINFFILIHHGTIKLTKSLENFLLMEKFFIQEQGDSK